jgi:hypothetical protein
VLFSRVCIAQIDCVKLYFPREFATCVEPDMHKPACSCSLIRLYNAGISIFANLKRNPWKCESTIKGLNTDIFGVPYIQRRLKTYCFHRSRKSKHGARPFCCQRAGLSQPCENLHPGGNQTPYICELLSELESSF